jgi:hypothetical protein
MFQRKNKMTFQLLKTKFRWNLRNSKYQDNFLAECYIQSSLYAFFALRFFSVSCFELSVFTENWGKLKKTPLAQFSLIVFYGVVCNLSQFYIIMDSSEQLILEKHTG